MSYKPGQSNLVKAGAQRSIPSHTRSQTKSPESYEPVAHLYVGNFSDFNRHPRGTITFSAGPPRSSLTSKHLLTFSGPAISTDHSNAKDQRYFSLLYVEETPGGSKVVLRLGQTKGAIPVEGFLVEDSFRQWLH